MPIIRLASNRDETFPEGAFCSLNYGRPEERRNWREEVRATGQLPYGPVVQYSTHHGLCLSEREHNMRDDSDFYMLVWNPEKGEPEEIMFATTRGWSYPCMGSHVDATDEVRAAHRAWAVKQERRMRIEGKWRARRWEAEMAEALGLPTRAAVRRLREALGQHLPVPPSALKPGLAARLHVLSDDFVAVARLLAARKLSSAFKLSLREQALAWALGRDTRHPTPLSKKQMRYL